jgi:hypothetical protein
MTRTSTATVPARNPTPTPTSPDPDGVPRVVVPADIDTADRIAWGLTFRQLVILAAGAVPLWLAYSRFGPRLPAVAWVAVGIVVTAVTVVIALGRRDGLPLDVWIRHGLTHQTSPRTFAPGMPGQGRALLTTAPARPVVPAPLRSSVTAFAADGTATVDGARRAVLACGTTSVGLRTGTEQAGLLEGFGQWLNALGGGVQIVVSAARHDLTPHADAVLTAAERLPDAALRAAAADHAAFLLDLDATREPLHRQVLTVVPAGHTVETTARALAALGVTMTVLDGEHVTAALAATVDPYAPPVPGPRAVPGTPITHAATRSEQRGPVRRTP